MFYSTSFIILTFQFNFKCDIFNKKKSIFRKKKKKSHEVQQNDQNAPLLTCHPPSLFP